MEKRQIPNWYVKGLNNGNDGRTRCGVNLSDGHQNKERNMTATFTVGEKEMLQNDMKQLTKSYYDALKRIKELTEK